jgi:3-hydroxypropanoate dehydrogenase
MQLDDRSLDIIFRDARTHSAWLDRPVTDEQLRALYDLMKFGPTTMNSGPARIAFVRSEEAKERLLPCMSAGNADKTRAAPVTAIIGYDLRYYEKLNHLAPHNPNARAAHEGKPHVEMTALRNGSLQGGYFIIAARALGLDCGPMAGFDHARVDAEFWAGTHVKTNFICNLGYGDPDKVRPRAARLAFDEACRLV